MKKKTEEKLLIKNPEKKENKINPEKEYDKKILKKVFINIIIAILIMLYLVGINIAYSKFEQPIIENIIKISTLTFLAIGLILMEISYKKENGVLLLNSIETLIIATHSLTLFHITKVFNFNFQVYVLTSSYIFSIYYVFKTIIIYTKGKKDYLNSLSDIPEIVKEEGPTKKESNKRKNIEDEEDKITKNNSKKMNKTSKNRTTSKSKIEQTKENVLASIRELTKENENKISTNKENSKNRKIKNNEDKETEKLNVENIENKPKKRGRPRKNPEKKSEENRTGKLEKNTNDKQKEDKNINKENAPKKRGRPRKNPENKKNVEENIAKLETKSRKEIKDTKEENIEIKPKKRGRPKKEVKIND